MRKKVFHLLAATFLFILIASPSPAVADSPLVAVDIPAFYVQYEGSSGNIKSVSIMLSNISDSYAYMRLQVRLEDGTAIPSNWYDPRYAESYAYDATLEGVTFQIPPGGASSIVIFPDTTASSVRICTGTLSREVRTEYVEDQILAYGHQSRRTGSTKYSAYGNSFPINANLPF